MRQLELYQLVSAISRAVEARDSYTSMHQSRVSALSRKIAQELSLSTDQIDCVRISAVLHDIGKLGIPTAILSKAGKLRKEEFDLIKLHPTIGEDILKEVDFSWPVATVVRQHHERLNGSGYPDRLTAKDILIEAKIIAVADVVEFMSQSRSYRQALGLEAALEEIQTNKDILYDRDVVDVCINIFSRNALNECFG